MFSRKSYTFLLLSLKTFLVSFFQSLIRLFRMTSFLPFLMRIFPGKQTKKMCRSYMQPAHTKQRLVIHHAKLGDIVAAGTTL